VRKPRKYKNVKTEVGGIKFDSKAEARRYSCLKLLEAAGEIYDLSLQPRFDLIVNGKKCGFYKADFKYIENGKEVIEDVKGLPTPVYRLKKKLVKAIYDIDIYETK